MDKSADLSRLIGNDLLGLVCIGTVAACLGLLINQFRDSRLPLIYESKEARIENAVARISAAPVAEAKPAVQLSGDISVEEMKSLVGNASVIILDARPEIFHRLGHIPGAISFPREDFENAYAALRPKLEADKAQAIVVYCSSASCEDSGLVIKGLKGLGYTNVALFHGGWSEWERAGLSREINE